jgi:hypothetical protein
MRRTSLFLIATAALVFAGCSSSSSPQEDVGAPTSTTTSSVVVSADNAAACKGFEEFKAARAARPTGGSDAQANAVAIQTYLGTLIAPLEAVKAGAPTDLIVSVDTLINSGKSAIALDPANPDDQAAIAQLVLSPPAENAAASDAVNAWASVNCGLDVSGS